MSKPRPLPVILLLDVSGSMDGEKIESLNAAVRDMISSFCAVADARGEIHVSVITFATQASQFITMTPAKDIQMPALEADGRTSLGAAIGLLNSILNDTEQIPPRAYIPTIVLVGDGRPTDEWRMPLDELMGSPRGQKTVRLAMGIGDDADYSVLKAFVNDEKIGVFKARDARSIKEFFQWVTLSVTSRTASQNPDEPIFAFDDRDDTKFEF
ncbi:VWA domain-containing protein [Paenibacillus sp. GCM10023248]|nr:VWA domain-containing protein [Paenibacillus sp. MAHUQ-63]